MRWLLHAALGPVVAVAAGAAGVPARLSRGADGLAPPQGGPWR